MKDGPNDVTIEVITWNMGNKPATDEVVEEFAEALKANPTVISLSTQEEMAPTGKRLQDKLLERLNQGLDEKNQYVLVQTQGAQYHSTMAGANNSLKTLRKAVLTDDNRVSTAMLVKKPYVLNDAKATIDYEEGKKKGNKSVISITGNLRDSGVPDGPKMAVNISGGHWDSNHDKKRRAHSDKHLKNAGVKSDQPKTHEQIVEEASTFRVVTGDFNERNYLMKDGSTTDKTHLTNYQSYGFDMDKEPKINLGDQKLSATYGHSFEGDNKENKETVLPDKKGRANVAKGGILDRVAIASGLTVKEGSYGSNLNKDHFIGKGKNQNKFLYHGSDHIPVSRNFTVTMPSKAQEQQIAIDYTLARIPQFGKEIAELKGLCEATDLEGLKEAAEALQYHDSTLEPVDFIKQLSGVDSNDFDALKEGLESKLTAKQAMQDQADALRFDLVSETSTEKVTKVFNQVTKCNELRNAAIESIGVSDEVLTPAEKAQFTKLSDDFVSKLTEVSLKTLNEKTPKVDLKNPELDQFIKDHPKETAKFAQARQAALESFVPNQAKGLSIQMPEPKPKKNFSQKLHDKVGDKIKQKLKDKLESFSNKKDVSSKVEAPNQDKKRKAEVLDPAPKEESTWKPGILNGLNNFREQSKITLGSKNQLEPEAKQVEPEVTASKRAKL